MTIAHTIKHIQLLKLKEHTKQHYLRTLVDLNLTLPTHITPTLTGITKGIHLLGRGLSCCDSVVKCGGGGYLSQFNLLYYISYRRLNDLYTAKA